MYSRYGRLLKIFSVSHSNDNTDRDTNNGKLCFKGIETFLRRIAFNLGNSPSQTEVKIISCIPIDVTDLQNKIISLERQLFEATNTKGSTKHAPIHTALIDPTKRNTNTVLSCKCSDIKPLSLGDTSDIMNSQCGNGSPKTRKSTVSFLFPTISSAGSQQNGPCTAENCIERQSIDTTIDGQYKRFFRKCKKKKLIKKKENRKTQLVYYAQTENSPFTSYGMSTDNPQLGYPKPKIDSAFSKSYLANVIQRHFDPVRVVEEFSDTSHFTSPVCRDLHSPCRCPYEADVCSCCHGDFQDVDNYIGKNQNFVIEPIATHLQNDYNKSIYYDSNLYDIVPVKEKAVKVSKDNKLLMKEQKRVVDIRCWPENARNKPRHQSAAMAQQTRKHTKLKNYKKPTSHLQNAKDNIKISTPNHRRENQVDKRTGPTDTSKSFCIDCSEIYTKPLFAVHKPDKAKTEQVHTIFRKNAECLTIDVNPKNLMITRSIQIDINSAETKTEETLNQIKSILQSVLTEVQTKPQVHNLSEANSKKDAIIQKGPSQSNIQTCSSLLHIFSYNNSYNTNPFLPSSSRQITTPFCFTNVPYHRPKLTQNFPLLIQTPGHQKCGCFYKSSSHKNTPTQKQAANKATNTEIDNRETQSGETEKLIKEIYKSIALTMDFQKETSNSECDELKSATNNDTDVSGPKNHRSTIVSYSDVSKRDIQIEASMTPYSTTTVKSNNNISLIGSEGDVNRNEIEHYLEYESQSPEHEILDAKEINRSKANVASTINEHYSEELTTDDEEMIETFEDIKEKIGKKGLFKRMLGSVKLFNKKKSQERKATKKQYLTHKVDDNKLESDSDDYQTIYSEEITRPEQNFDRKRHYKPRNYATYRPIQENTARRIRSNRRSPYMEQEYRRRWNEQLMFQENRGRRYSSERPYSFQQSPVYWQNYEARSAMVDHRIPYQSTYSPNYNTPIKPVVHKDQRTSPLNTADRKEAKSKFTWLKKHKLGISQCGEQWKKFILEN